MYFKNGFYTRYNRHFGETLFNGIPLIKVHEKWYNELSSYKFGGIFHFSTPILIVRDPELIKNICTKDFDYFINRLDNELDENEPFALNLFGLRGQKWKILRSKLTPTFTSGKMKVMFHIIKEYNRELVKMIDKMNMEKDVLETKELMARYTTDIISSCIFGLQSNSQNDPNSVFRCMGKKIFNFSLRNLITTIVQDISPKIRKILGMNIIEKNIIEFFSSIVKNNIKYREENNVNKNDFIDLLISLKKEKILNFKVNEDTEVKMEFTDDALTAQCFFFYLAGSETTAGALTFALYEIAKHGDIQNILFNEVEKIIDEYEELTYESLQKMTYLEQVINETLRMYPIAPFLMRVCNKDYLLDDDTMIEKGTRIIIPIMGLHHDPQYYENPTEFNPENFSKEAKEQRHRYVYLPFGEGPHINQKNEVKENDNFEHKRMPSENEEMKLRETKFRLATCINSSTTTDSHAVLKKHVQRFAK
ncbi:hypothetical protein PGB90_006840 [Kerria lacca]